MHHSTAMSVEVALSTQSGSVVNIFKQTDFEDHAKICTMEARRIWVDQIYCF
jgi:hypothetical protein